MIEYLEHHIVDHCNLKCNGCSHFSGLAEPWFEDINDFINDFSALKNVTGGRVGTIRIMGGEPLLHPDVCSFLIVVRQLFPNSEIQIVTNGILLNRVYNLSNICNNYGIIVCTSDYGFGDKIREYLVNFRYIRIDNKNNMYNISLDLLGNQNKIESFEICDLHKYKWYFFQHGKLYHCCIGANIQTYNKYFKRSLPVPDGISVYNHTEKEIIEYLNSPIDLCKYCNTKQRESSYHQFCLSKGEESEWICH